MYSQPILSMVYSCMVVTMIVPMELTHSKLMLLMMWKLPLGVVNLVINVAKVVHVFWLLILLAPFARNVEIVRFCIRNVTRQPRGKNVLHTKVHVARFRILVVMVTWQMMLLTWKLYL